MMEISDPNALQEQCLAWRASGLRTVLVPTMGFFHQGHERLMQQAKELGDKVIVSVFVNPAQFGPKEDLSTYPRDLDKDRTIAEGNKVSLFFTPQPEAMYPKGYDTWVEVPGLAKRLCGKTRPTHFRGVCTVVLKLLNLTMPQHAMFGEKDWQQLAIVRRMVKDLNLPVHIEGVPIVREADGLAMSSRNSYLTQEERALAPHFNKGLVLGRQLFASGERNPEVIKNSIIAYWNEHIPKGRLDYLQLVAPDSLEDVKTVDAGTMALAAMYLGKPRLIDNLPLGEGAV